MRECTHHLDLVSSWGYAESIAPLTDLRRLPSWRKSAKLLLGALLHVVQMYVSCCWTARHDGQKGDRQRPPSCHCFGKRLPRHLMSSPIPQDWGKEERKTNTTCRLLYCSRDICVAAEPPSTNAFLHISQRNQAGMSENRGPIRSPN